jgi:hypothetical protein
MSLEQKQYYQSGEKSGMRAAHSELLSKASEYPNSFFGLLVAAALIEDYFSEMYGEPLLSLEGSAYDAD